MPSEPLHRVLATIDYNIDLANRFLANLTLKEFSEDSRTLYAVTRCLEIISEASRRLPADMKERHPQIQWTQIAGAGNVYRHDYEDVVAGILWHTVQTKLGPLRSVVLQELQKD